MNITLNPALETQIGNSPEVFEAITEAANQIWDVFNLIAPRRTGAMVASAHMTPEQTTNGKILHLTIDPVNEDGTHYAAYVEFGTSRMAAQHNLRYALETVEAETQ
ncbi:hypothetical protein AY551_01325 [Corynebacterium diphtheriae bv. gravis]|uniref:hypothetical protein n=1 Tax=Corynebacterium diphtheriae TaxID=1717 RepID=UPI000B4BEDC3|nr:hypothetical protein [Corynebacterium diphtheriae]OWN69285.1 hypothetical protein AY518_03040 [Corynebacterium diphtheriae bv. gravis]OWO50073.1 hypothetical protein AY551_01325 [Corynebacterium diphtheriae bv. gravis]CAB1035821.1 hypothetical protein NCTC10648_01011 [Corynebacterium diphtheriae]